MKVLNPISVNQFKKLSFKNLVVVRINQLKAVVVACLLSVPAIAQYSPIPLTSPNPWFSGFLGVSASSSGDVNSDGIPDVVVGGLNERNAELVTAGRAYIFSGAGDSTLQSFDSPNPEWSGFFGCAVAGVGDVNGDGVPDVVIGAYGEAVNDEFDAGRAYVFSGNGGLIYTLTSPTPEGGSWFGSSVSGVGDVDNDGVPDIIVGARYEDSDTTNDGRAHVFSGVTGALLYTLSSSTPSVGGLFGISVSDAGDVDNDGHNDIIVGATLETADFGSGPFVTGRVHIYSGLDGSELFNLFSPGAQFSGSFGRSVSGVGDANSDGFDDIVVGAIAEDVTHSDAGRAYIISGADGSLIHALDSPNGQVAGWFGSSVSVAGDVNADGIADIIVGAQFEDGEFTDAGMTYIFSGADGILLHSFSPPDEKTLGYFGMSVSDIGDINEDGIGDVIIAGSAGAGENVHIFVSESGSSAISCEDISKFRAKYAATTNTIKLGVKLIPGSGQDGKIATFLINGVDTITAEVANSKAVTNIACSGVGDHIVELIDPHGCGFAQITVSGCAVESTGFPGDQLLETTNPATNKLFQNYPNPFNPTTTIGYELNEDKYVTIKIYNSIGQEVATLVNERQSAGYKTVVWDGKNQTGQAVTSGIYIYRMTAGRIVQTNKMLLTR